MQKTLKRFTAIFLSLAIIFVAQPAMAEQRLIDINEHSEIAYSEMQYVRYDFAQFEKMLEELQALAAQPDNKDNVLAFYDELLYETDIMRTMSALATINYYSNTRSTYWQEERSLADEATNRALDSFDVAVSRLLESEYEKAALAHIGHEYAEGVRGHEGMTDEQQQLFADDLALTLKYYELEESLVRYSNDFYDAVGENYLEALQVRSRLAAVFDYDSFDSFANELYYYRDYSYSESKRLFESVQKYVVPLYQKLQKNYEREHEQIVSEYSPLAVDAVVELVGGYIREISPELAIPWDYMQRNKLYDIDPSPTKANIGFTIGLPMYKSAFILNSPDGGVLDMQTLVHEFGHFVQAYYNPVPAAYQIMVLDLCEVHSQGLEALFSRFYPEIYGDNAGSFENEMILGFLRTIIDYSYIAELETEIYRLDNPSIGDLKKLAAELGMKYWPRASKSAMQTYWLGFPHVHTSPMYSASYAVSALAALDLWVQSHVDEAAATDSYLKLVSLHNSEYFGNALRKSGLSNIFRQATIELLCENIETILLEGGKPRDVIPGVPQSYSRIKSRESNEASALKAEKQGLTKEMDFAMTAVITAVIVVICVVIVLRSRNDNTNQS